MQNGAGHATLRSLPSRSEAATETLTNDALHLFGFARANLNQSLPVMRMNAGAGHLFLALNSRAKLPRMRYDLDAGRSFMQRHGFVTITLAYRENDRLLHVRNAFASGGVLEDPATGAAAAALGECHAIRTCYRLAISSTIKEWICAVRRVSKPGSMM